MSQHSTEERTAILNRLKSAEGHLQAIVIMVEMGRPCKEVLHQLDAVAAALSAAGCALRNCEFRACAEIILYSRDPEVRAIAVQRLATLYGVPTRRLTVMENALDEHPK